MNAWSYTSTPQYVFMAWCLVKHRDNLTFILSLPTRTDSNILVITASCILDSSRRKIITFWSPQTYSLFGL